MNDPILAMLSKHADMEDGRLINIKDTEHIIYLQPGIDPIRQTQYRAGHNERDFDRLYAAKMYKVGVMASPV